MLEQVAPPELTRGELHLLQRKRLTDQHEKLMQQILTENSHKDKYWILGMANCKRKNKKTRITPFLEAHDSLPDLRKESYLYEVDNIAGTRSLLWVMHPNNKLSMPTIGKTIHAAGAPA